MALSYSQLAPAISPLPPSDRRCRRAAGFPTRRLSPAADDRASGTRPGPPFECIALLLQGGGALGAYQAGVYEALAEADLHPNWIAGISIGAINGALIAGNAPEARVDRLRAFWERITAKPYCDWSERLFPAKSDAVRQWLNQMSANLTLAGGASGFFQVDLWNARGELPRTIAEVATRQKEIQFSSRTRAGTDSFKHLQRLRRALADLLEKLPETLRNGPEAQLLQPVGDHKVYNIVHLIYRAKDYEGQSKDYDFSRASMDEHWRAGYHDAIRTLRHPEVLERATNHEGVFTFDLFHDGRE
jgi:predicted acylesterase/phospholipase RssA